MRVRIDCKKCDCRTNDNHLLYIHSRWSQMKKRMKVPKNFRIDFRCTEEEFFSIEEMARSCSMTKSDYVRQVVLGFRPKKKLTDDELHLLQDVRKATSDLQHISNYFSKGWYSKLMAELKPIVQQLKDLIYDRDRKKH